MRNLYILALGFLISASGCEPTENTSTSASRASPIVPVDSGVVIIMGSDTPTPLRVEIAETPQATRIGLMDRDSIGADEGMIFLFDDLREPTDGFWMFRTRIPLDIAYLDSSGVIVAIYTMEPCESPVADYCPEYPSGRPYSAALEVSGGYFAEHGISVGDSLVLLREE